MEKHPDLKAHCGLSPDDELDARGIAALSEISINGMKARMLLEQADAGIRELSSEEKGRCLADLALLGVMLDHNCTCRSDRRRRRKTPLVCTLVGIVTLLLALVARDL